MVETLWLEIPKNEEYTSALIQKFDCNPLIARHLADLFPGAPERVEAFLKPSLNDLLDPFTMADMEKAVERLKNAVAKNEKIRVVTDYDVDGTTSGLILQSVLEILGHRNLSYHIPHRFKEGYGFSILAAQKAVEDGVDLIITADIGVRDVEAIDYVQKNGVDVLVLDHHLPDRCEVPESAFAVLCPPRSECAYENKDLAACGISLKFAQALLKDKPNYRALIDSMLKLASIGTVADVVNISGRENRAIVACGLKELNTGRHSHGLSALLRYSGVQPGQISSGDIGYKIAPRINAAGRLESATLVIELLHAKNALAADELAARIDALNSERRETQWRMFENARQMTDRRPDDSFIFVVDDESDIWHRGVIGIVAGRLRDHYGKSAAVGTKSGDEIVVSVRTTPGIHAVKALDSAKALMLRYGGHAAAAGFTIKAQFEDEIRERLNAFTVRALCGENEKREYRVVAAILPEMLDEHFLSDLKRLEPFGKGNEEPYFVFPVATATDIRIAKDIHVFGRFYEYPGWDWVIFNAPEFCAKLRAMNNRASWLGHIRTENFQGRVRRKFYVEDIRALPRGHVDAFCGG